MTSRFLACATGRMGKSRRRRFGVERELCSFWHVLSLRYLLGIQVELEQAVGYQGRNLGLKCKAVRLEVTKKAFGAQEDEEQPVKRTENDVLEAK